MSGNIWHHDPLARDLAAHLRHGGERMTWLNISLGGPHQARPDVYSMRRFSYARPEMVSYEVKISESDLRGDLVSGKWQKYLEFSQGVTFALPQGLPGVSDIPRECGVIIRGERMWRHTRKPVLKRAALPIDAAIKLISAMPDTGTGVDTDSPEFEFKRNIANRYEHQLQADARRKIGERLGREVAEYLRAPEAARDIIDRANREADGIVERARGDQKAAEKLWAELAEAAGADAGANAWKTRQAVAQLCQRITSGTADSALYDVLEKLRGEFNEALRLRDLAKAPQ